MQLFYRKHHLKYNMLVYQIWLKNIWIYVYLYTYGWDSKNFHWYKDGVEGRGCIRPCIFNILEAVFKCLDIFIKTKTKTKICYWFHDGWHFNYWHVYIPHCYFGYLSGDKKIGLYSVLTFVPIYKKYFFKKVTRNLIIIFKKISSF